MNRNKADQFNILVNTHAGDSTHSENPLAELYQLINILPAHIQAALKGQPVEEAIEFVLDLGRMAEVRFLDGSYEEIGTAPIEQDDIDHVVSRLSEFSTDNRSGITKTLHRISAIRNRKGDIVGLTCRVGRVILGTIAPIEDIIASGKSILLLGRPGVGKTTKLREIAKIMANDSKRRVVIVDTSNEIAGDGDIPHPVVGRARRMQVSTPLAQQSIMIEAVENHTPEVIIIDEIGTEAEAQAARTIAERGLILVATAHGSKLENLLKNPVLSDLIGGIQSVTLGDEEAKRRATQKTILEREKQPTFDVCIELRDKETLAVYHNVAQAVDEMLRGFAVNPEIRRIEKDGSVKVLNSNVKQIADPHNATPQQAIAPEASTPLSEKSIQQQAIEPFSIFLYAVTRSFIERILERLNLQHLITLTTSMHESHAVLALRGHARPGAKVLKLAMDYEVPCYYSKTNTMPQIQRCLREALEATEHGQRILAHIEEHASPDNPSRAWINADLMPEEQSSGSEETDAAIAEAEEGIRTVEETGQSYELSPRRSYIRRLQHDHVETYNLTSISVGAEPDRRLKILPKKTPRT